MILLLLLVSLLTPGVAQPFTQAKVCGIRWGRDARHVTEPMKREVAARYHMRREEIVARGFGPCCEFDHLIPRELGGADDVDNIWPQAWSVAVVKDAEENALHRAVCIAKTMTLIQAQAEIVRRWAPR